MEIKLYFRKMSRFMEYDYYDVKNKWSPTSLKPLGSGYYVYIHIGKRRDSGKYEIFYVGKGSGNRANAISGRNNQWKNRTTLYSQIIPIKIFENISEERTLLFEFHFIKFFQSIKAPITNIKYKCPDKSSDLSSEMFIQQALSSKTNKYLFDIINAFNISNRELGVGGILNMINKEEFNKLEETRIIRLTKTLEVKYNQALALVEINQLDKQLKLKNTR